VRCKNRCALSQNQLLYHSKGVPSHSHRGRVSLARQRARCHRPNQCSCCLRRFFPQRWYALTRVQDHDVLQIQLTIPENCVVTTRMRVRNSPKINQEGIGTPCPSRVCTQYVMQMKSVNIHVTTNNSSSPVSLWARKTFMNRKRRPIVRHHGGATNRPIKNPLRERPTQQIHPWKI
jgi:hypothetical protein